MKCEEFWKQVEDFLGDSQHDQQELPVGLKRHLEACDFCKLQWELLVSGLDQLKKEVNTPEDPLFWADMRSKIRKNIKRPGKWYDFFKHWEFWTFATVTATALVIFFGIFFTKSDLITRQDVAEMFEQPSYITLYEGNVSTMDNIVTDDQEDPYLIAGLTDPWSVTLDETLTDSGGTS